MKLNDTSDCIVLCFLSVYVCLFSFVGLLKYIELKNLKKNTVHTHSCKTVHFYAQSDVSDLVVSQVNIHKNVDGKLK